MKMADIIGKLTAKRERLVRDFEGLALAVFEGREVNIDRVESILAGAGRSTADLQEAVARHQRRADRRAAIAAAAAAREQMAKLQGQIEEEETLHARAEKAHRAKMAKLLQTQDALQRTVSAGNAAESEALREPDPTTGERRAEIGQATLWWQRQRLRLTEATRRLEAEAAQVRENARCCHIDKDRQRLEAEADQLDRHAETNRQQIEEGDRADRDRKEELATIERRVAAG